MIDFKKLFKELNDRIDKPIEFNHILSMLIQDLDARSTNGNVVWEDGVPYIEDPSRSKTLSMSRPFVSFSRYGANLSMSYMKVGETVGAGDQGVLMPRKGTITSLVVKSRSNDNYFIEVRRNNSPSPICTVQVMGGVGISDQLDVDFEQFDNIQLFIQGSYVDHPIANLEWAWRL